MRMTTNRTSRSALCCAALLVIACARGDGDESPPSRDVEVFCAREYGCFPDDYRDEAECVLAYDHMLVDARRISRPCGEAGSDLLTCLATLSCAQLGTFWTERESDGPCRREERSMAEHCESGGVRR